MPLHSGKLPDFMIIGAAKAGTTTLYDDLARHPGICLPAFKEPDILHRARSEPEARLMYSRHFAAATPGQLCGEASTYYTMLPTFPEVADLAKQVCGPVLKLIYIMRNPIARIRSHLAHDFAVGRLGHTDFDRAVRDDPRYLAWSDYPMQAKPWIETFGLDQILFLSFETFVADRSGAVAQVVRHLGLDPVEMEIGAGISNQRGSQRQVRHPLVAQLIGSEFYRYGLRPLLPGRLVEGGKALSTRRRAVPPVTFSPETEERLALAFADQNTRLARLGVTVFPGAEPRRAG